MKIAPSTKIALGFAGLVAIGYGGYRGWQAYQLAGVELTPVAPGKVSIIGVSPEAGVSVIVANKMAQLVESDNANFSAGDSSNGGGATQGAIKKRIPVREWIGVLSGDQDSLGKFVMIMANKREDEKWPSERVIWKQEDVEKAIAGDAALKKKLEEDINMTLEGRPLSQLSLRAFYNGIVLDYPVTLKVRLGKEEKTLVGRFQEPYQPRFIAELEKSLSEKNVDESMIAGTYRQAAQELLSPDSEGRKRPLENIADTIRNVYEPSKVRGYVAKAEPLVKGSTVVVSADMIKTAVSNKVDTNEGPRWEIRVKLTDEGRKRLWKYSLDNVGKRVLLIANDVPIAAASISHELMQGELVITQLEDESLVEEAIELISGVKTASTP